MKICVTKRSIAAVARIEDNMLVLSFDVGVKNLAMVLARSALHGCWKSLSPRDMTCEVVRKTTSDRSVMFIHVRHTEDFDARDVYSHMDDGR